MAPESASSGPGPNRSRRPADGALVRQFLRSSHIFHSALREIIDARDLAESRGFSLTPSQLQLLKLIAADGQHTVSDVGAFLGVTAPAATKWARCVPRSTWRRCSRRVVRSQRPPRSGLRVPSRRLAAGWTPSPSRHA